MIFRESELEPRWSSVQDSLESTGTYAMTEDELEFACRTAWRNAPRCPGRINWKSLQIFDCR